MRETELFAFIKERQSIYTKKEVGLPKPWTDDKILRQYKFCNMYREQDTVTRWIKENWRTPLTEDEHLWFAMVIARLVNWPETLTELTPLPWSSTDFIDTLQRRKKAGEKVFSGAYIVSTNGMTMDKAEYLAYMVLEPLWQKRDAIKPRKGDTLASFAQRLGIFNGMGTFLTGQVIADTKEAIGSPLFVAEDWHTWASPGPGSKRGLNRVLNRPKDAPWGRDWFSSLNVLQRTLSPMLAKAGLPPMDAQNTQNCLCEWDKYERVRLGEGTPRSTYPGVR